MDAIKSKKKSPFAGHKHERVLCPYCKFTKAKNMYHRHVEQCKKLGNLKEITERFYQDDTLTLAAIAHECGTSDHFTRDQLKAGLRQHEGMTTREAHVFIKKRGSAVSAKSRTKKRVEKRKSMPRCESCTMLMLPHENAGNGTCKACDMGQ